MRSRGPLIEEACMLGRHNRDDTKDTSASMPACPSESGQRVRACKHLCPIPLPPNIFAQCVYPSGCIRFAISGMHLSEESRVFSAQVAIGLGLKIFVRISKSYADRSSHGVQREGSRGKVFAEHAEKPLLLVGNSPCSRRNGLPFHQGMPTPDTFHHQGFFA
jgi:hypothetical protein